MAVTPEVRTGGDAAPAVGACATVAAGAAEPTGTADGTGPTGGAGRTAAVGATGVGAGAGGRASPAGPPGTRALVAISAVCGALVTVRVATGAASGTLARSLIRFLTRS